MRKTNVLFLSVLAVALLSSAFFSIAAAQEATDTATPDPSAVPEPSVGPQAADKADETQISPSDGNVTSPDDPVIDEGNPILYTTQDDGNGTLAPGMEDANRLAAQAAPDYTLPIVAIGIVLAVIVGGIIGTVHYRKQASKAQN